MPPLDGPRGKLARALEHIETFVREAAAFLDSKPYRAPRETDPKTGNHVYRLIVDRPAPVRLGILVGDAAHNLRSSLDHLVWQLALLTTKSPSRSTQFPIRDNPSAFGKYLDERARQMICDLPEEAKKVVESIQPYMGLESGPELLTLHRISNLDKHQNLLVPGAQVLGAALPGFRPETAIAQGGVFFRTDSACEHNDVLFCVAANMVDQLGMTEQADFMFHLAIRPTRGLRPHMIASNLLFRIHKTISDDVIPRFAGFFPTQD